MKIPAFIIAIFLGAIIGLQSWVLTEVIALKVNVATIAASQCHCRIAAADSQYGQSSPTAVHGDSAQNHFEFTHK